MKSDNNELEKKLHEFKNLKKKLEMEGYKLEINFSNLLNEKKILEEELRNENIDLSNLEGEIIRLETDLNDNMKKIEEELTETALHYRNLEKKIKEL